METTKIYAGAFAKVNSTANFGINISDGYSSTLNFHVTTITVKVNGYDDLAINLNKDCLKELSASKVS